jgi:hypothetical protein
MELVIYVPSTLLLLALCRRVPHFSSLQTKHNKASDGVRAAVHSGGSNDSIVQDVEATGRPRYPSRGSCRVIQGIQVRARLAESRPRIRAPPRAAAHCRLAPARTRTATHTVAQRTALVAGAPSGRPAAISGGNGYGPAVLRGGSSPRSGPAVCPAGMPEVFELKLGYGGKMKGSDPTRLYDLARVHYRSTPQDSEVSLGFSSSRLA